MGNSYFPLPNGQKHKYPITNKKFLEQGDSNYNYPRIKKSYKIKDDPLIIYFPLILMKPFTIVLEDLSNFRGIDYGFNSLTKESSLLLDASTKNRQHKKNN